MNCKSFFQLPLLFIIINFFIGVGISSSVFFNQNLDNVDMYFIIYHVVHPLFYALPELLIALFVVSLVLYHCQVIQFTLKNVLYLFIISVIVNVLIYLCDKFISINMWNSFNQYLDYQLALYFDYQLIHLLFSIIISLVNCLIICLVSYYTIANLKDRFDQNFNTKFLSVDNSGIVHLVLFIVLLMFLYLFFSIPLIDFISFFGMHQSTGFAIFLIIMLIIFCIIYFSIKGSFNRVFNKIYTVNIVKSVLISFILSVVVNLIILAITSAIIIMLILSSHSNDESSFILIVLLGFILQIVLTYFVLRAVTKRYFSPVTNEI